MWKCPIASFCPRVEDTGQHAGDGHREGGLWRREAQLGDDGRDILPIRWACWDRCIHLGAAIVRYAPGVMLTVVNTISIECRKFLGRCYEHHLTLQVRRPRLDVPDYTTLIWWSLDTNSYGPNSKLLHVIIKPRFLRRKRNIRTRGVLVENEHFWSLLQTSRIRLPPPPANEQEALEA